MEFDLFILAADKTMCLTLRAILSRPQSLGTRWIDANVQFHPRHDPGVLREGHDFLRSWQARASHALVMFDRKGCGSAHTREALELDVKGRLERSGWKDRCDAVVIDPELEAWFWSDSLHVEKAVGFRGREQLDAWLIAEGHLHQGERKPRQPKEAVLQALRQSKIPFSPSIYYDLAARVSFERCADAAFSKLRSVLNVWYPPE